VQQKIIRGVSAGGDDVVDSNGEEVGSDESLPDEGVLEVCKDFYAKAGEPICAEEDDEEQQRSRKREHIIKYIFIANNSANFAILLLLLFQAARERTAAVATATHPLLQSRPLIHTEKTRRP